MEESMLYVIKAGPYVKIGRSKNLRRRIVEIQTHCPLKCEVIFCSKTGLDNWWERHLERELHKRFAKFWERGEWFNADVETVIKMAELFHESVSKMQDQYRFAKDELGMDLCGGAP
jgi:hypothetical protein